MTTTMLEEDIIRDLRKIYKLRATTGKVLISVTDKDLVDHHVLVPMPKSYEVLMNDIYLSE